MKKIAIVVLEEKIESQQKEIQSLKKTIGTQDDTIKKITFKLEDRDRELRLLSKEISIVKSLRKDLLNDPISRDATPTVYTGFVFLAKMIKDLEKKLTKRP